MVDWDSVMVLEDLAFLDPSASLTGSDWDSEDSEDSEDSASLEDSAANSEVSDLADLTEVYMAYTKSKRNLLKQTWFSVPTLIPWTLMSEYYILSCYLRELHVSFADFFVNIFLSVFWLKHGRTQFWNIINGKATFVYSLFFWSAGHSTGTSSEFPRWCCILWYWWMRERLC